jgi:hypothetical protein
VSHQFQEAKGPETENQLRTALFQNAFCYKLLVLCEVHPEPKDISIIPSRQIMAIIINNVCQMMQQRERFRDNEN